MSPVAPIRAKRRQPVHIGRRQRLPSRLDQRGARSELEEHARSRCIERVERRVKTNRAPRMIAPVGRVGQIAARRFSGDRRHDADARRVPWHRAGQPLNLVEHLIRHARDRGSFEEPRAARDHRQAVLQRENACHARGRVLSHAVAKHEGRLHAPAAPHLSECALEGEQYRLGVGNLVESATAVLLRDTTPTTAVPAGAPATPRRIRRGLDGRPAAS